MTNADTDIVLGKRQPGLGEREPGLLQCAREIGFSAVEILELKRLYDLESQPK